MTDAVLTMSAGAPARRDDGTRTRVRRIAILAVCVLAALASTARGAEAVVHPEAWPAAGSGIRQDAAAESFVEQLLGSMTTEEKVGQLIQADIAFVTPDEVRQYRLGSVLAGGNAAPGGDVRSPPQSWLNLADEFFRASVAGPPARHVPIPVLFGIDAVHGHARIGAATIFPHNVGLGATHDAALIEQIGRVTAAEVSATGIDWTFAPTVAVARDVRWGRSYESYSDDPALVADYARAMVSGLQGRVGTPDFMAPGHTLASVKHFLGDGGTVRGRDQFDNLADERTLREVHGAAYPAALSAGALIVMASYNGWHGVKMHGNPALLTGVLKDRWAFSGFTIGDWNAHEELPGCTKSSCPQMLNAGVDMYMAPDGWKALYENLLGQVRSGEVGAARLDDAVRRILRVKVLARIFDKGAPKERAADPLRQLGSAEHRALARQAVRESLVLLKNNGQLLPLDARAKILVTGPGADDIGVQSGGWTIDWQGAHNLNADFPGATSILGGIRAAVAAAGGTVLTSLDRIAGDKPGAAIVVYGETPYAEFEGDRETLEFDPGPNRALLRGLRAAGIPVVSVFMSGRPMWVNRELNSSDAFIAAWLPGSEGGGVADLLFRPPPGGPTRDFKGRLSFAWPATAMPVAFDESGTVHGALFARGYGLSLRERHELGRLPEDPQVPAGLRARDTLFHLGHVTAPWSVYVTDAAAEVRLTMQSQPSPLGTVTAALEDGSIQASWSGVGIGEFRIGGRARDLRSLVQSGAALVAEYRVDERPAGQVFVGVRCEAPYGTSALTAGGGPPPDWRRCGTRAGAKLDLTSQLRAAQPGVWHTLELPFACIATPAATLDTVSAPLTIESAARFAIRFREVRIRRERSAVPCPASSH